MVGHGPRLMQPEAVFRHVIEQWYAALRGVRDFFAWEELGRSEETSQIASVTEIATARHFAMQIGLAELWTCGAASLRVRGHIVSEIAAACVCRLFSLERVAQSPLARAIHGRFASGEGGCSRPAWLEEGAALTTTMTKPFLSRHSTPRSLTSPSTHSIEAMFA